MVWAGQARVEAADLVDAERDEGIGSGLPMFVQGRRGGVWFAGGGGEPGVGEHGEGDVPVPGVPEADLIVVEANLVLGRLEALLHGPADADHGDQFVERGIGLGVADEEGELGGIVEGATDEKPVGGAGGVDEGQS